MLRRCNRHEWDQVRVRICHAERLGIDTDRLNLPSFRYDDPGKPSTWGYDPIGYPRQTKSDDKKLRREDRAWQRLNDAILLEEAATMAVSAPASTTPHTARHSVLKYLNINQASGAIKKREITLAHHIAT